MSMFQTDRSEQEVFDDLRSLCTSSGFIHVLAILSHQDNFISYSGDMTSEVMATSYTPSRTIRTEFSTLLGLMFNETIDFTHPGAQQIQSMLTKTTELLEELHACLNKPMIESMKALVTSASGGLQIDASESLLKGDVLREPIFYGGESAFNFQYRKFAAKRYGNDDDWLKETKGFTSTHAKQICDAISKVQTRKVVEVIKSLREVHPNDWTPLEGFTLTSEELTQETELSVEIIEAFLEAFTAPPPPANQQFCSLSDFNIANAQPFIRVSDRHVVLLQSYNLDEALYDSPFYWMAADADYKEIAFKNRGAFTENFVAERLSNVFSDSHVYQNVELKKGKKRVGEIDVLVLYADRAFVIQCKSKRLTIEARKGNDLQIQLDFKKSVQDSYDQAAECAAAIRDKEILLVGSDGREIEYSALKQIYPICVVSDHYPALSYQANEFLEFQADNTVQPPLVTDVFFIDVLAEMLDTPLHLLSYVDRRVNYGDRVVAINELTILSYHLKSNLWLDEEMGGLMLTDDIAIDLDTAFTVRRQDLDGDRNVKGIMTHIAGLTIDRLIKSIERRAEPALVNLGFLLLRLSGDTLKDLNRGLDQIAKQTKQDGKHHDFSLVFGTDAGITAHCSDLPNDEAAEKLLSHCRMRKYVQKADEWHGLAIRADDALPKFGMNLDTKWTHDPELESATRHMVVQNTAERRGNRFKSSKPGRNADCPCGSGKKFKKCCLRRWR